MFKKFIFIISAFFVVSWASVDLSLKSGWNLVGNIYDDINATSAFDSATSIWKYDGKWMATSPNTTLTTSLKSANIENFEIINAGEGFWVNIK